LETYSLVPANFSCRGAIPVLKVCLTVPAAGSIATTVFWPLIAAYSVEPSGEKAMPAVSACLPSTVGMLIFVPAPSEPSPLKG